MGRVYRFLGLTVGVIIHGLDEDERAAGLRLRHHLRHQQRVRLRLPARQHGDAPRRDGPARPPLRDRRRGRLDPDRRGAHAADHLGPQPRTAPSSTGPSTRWCRELGKDALRPRREAAQVSLTEEGPEHVEEMLERGRRCSKAPASTTPRTSRSSTTSTRRCGAQALQRDQDYIVRAGEVILVDEFTGRMMHGRRCRRACTRPSRPRKVRIQPENQTLASVTIQNYFRLYEKLSGMTGTAATEAAEFLDIYKLDVVEIPTNRPVIRERRRRRGLPHRATRRTRRSSSRSRTATARPADPGRHRLDREVRGARRAAEAARHPAQVLNARYHEQEAYIVAEAGVPGAVTIATNMAGRGTDIQLGGNVDMRIAPGARAARSRAPGATERPPHIRAEVEAEREKALRRRRPLRARHRAPREPAHRQPAARPHRPPGRPRPLQVLPVAARTTCCASSPASGWTRSCAPSACRKARRSPTSG